MANEEGSGPVRPQGEVPGSSSAPGPPTSNVHVSVTTGALNIRESSLSALDRLARHSPKLASSLVEAAKHSESHETHRYLVGAFVAGTVCCVMIVAVALTIIVRGFLSGIAFFLVCAAVAAIFSAVFTGKSQSLNWTVGIIPGRRERSDENEDGPG